MLYDLSGVRVPFRRLLCLLGLSPRGRALAEGTPLDLRHLKTKSQINFIRFFYFGSLTEKTRRAAWNPPWDSIDAVRERSCSN